jgi:hypothetical protein
MVFMFDGLRLAGECIVVSIGIAAGVSRRPFFARVDVTAHLLRGELLEAL